MPGVAVGTVMLLCLLPVGTMITGSIIVTFFQPGPKLTSAMQHFAAGIVLAAVALELAPQTALMIHKQNGVFTIAMLLGFFAAIALLMVISRYFDADDEEDEKKDDDVKKEKEVEVFTSNPAIGAPATSFNLDIGSNKSTAYNSPASTPPRSPMEKDLDTNSMPGQMGGNQWEQSPPAYNNNNNWNNNNNNNWNNNNMNNNSRDRDNSFPSQIDRVRYGTVDNRDNASDVSASSYSNNSQSPLSRGGDSSSSVSGASRAPVSRNYNQGGYGNYNNNNGYGNNNNNWNNNNWNSNQRGPYPPPPAPPAMPAPEGDWNGGNNSNNWGNNNNNNGNWGNNNGNWGNNNNGNMYNSNNWNTRTRQRGVSQHTWQPRVRYAAQWKNQGRSDMGFVPPPPPRRNQGGMGMNNGGNQWGNNNPDLTQTHTRMPSYMLHGMASTGLAKSMQRKSINQPAPFTPVYNTTLNTDVSKPGTTAAPVGPFSMPWGIIVAVAVDASTDGILIGVASAVGQGGLVVALALAIEMTFLGISTSIEMTEANVPKYLQIPLLMILPCFVLVGGAIGATVMAGVTGPLFVAFLSFGMAALLFLVTEELLIAAHEDLAHDTWYVSISFFVGFIIVLIMDQFSGPDMCADRINVASLPLINALQANGLPVPPFGV